MSIYYSLILLGLLGMFISGCEVYMNPATPSSISNNNPYGDPSGPMSPYWGTPYYSPVHY